MLVEICFIPNENDRQVCTRFSAHTEISGNLQSKILFRINYRSSIAGNPLQSYLLKIHKDKVVELKVQATRVTALHLMHCKVLDETKVAKLACEHPPSSDECCAGSYDCFNTNESARNPLAGAVKLLLTT